MENIAIGIDLGGTNIRGALVNKAGDVIEQSFERTPAEAGSSAVIEKINSVIDQLLAVNKNISGIGIGTPGIIDHNTGDIVGASPNIADWPGTPLGRILASRYKVQIQVENDVNAITMGEIYFGGQDIGQNVAVIALGTGVGVGIILNGKIARWAHELGHMIVNCQGSLCSCGRQGCLESEASGKSILKKYMRLKGGPSLEESADIRASAVFDKWQDNCPHAKEVVNDFIIALASAMANIILSYSITNFIITGGVSNAFSKFQGPLLKEVKKRSISHLNDRVTIKKGSLDDGIAGMLGAASLILGNHA